MRGFGHLIVDRDPLYTKQFERLMASAGVKLLRLPANSPNLNAYAERFVRSIKQECLQHIIPLGERHLRGAVSEFVEYYQPSAITKASATSSRSRRGPRPTLAVASADTKGSAGC